MTRDQFLKDWDKYHTEHAHEAVREASAVNVLANGFRVVAVHLPGTGYCLMLDTAAQMIVGIGVNAEIVSAR